MKEKNNFRYSQLATSVEVDACRVSVPEGFSRTPITDLT